MVLLNREDTEIPHKVFNILDNKFKNQNFGGLFNAYTEKSYAYGIKTNPSPINWISDSGGLQVITQGKRITPTFKDSIYKIQTECSNIAMCFDEMPIKLIGDSVGRFDLSNRFFMDEDCVSCG